MTPDLETLAAGLSEAQRRAIVNATWIHPGAMAPICLVDFVGPWTVPIAEFFTIKKDGLNDLGLQLRNHISRTRGEGELYDR